MAEYNVHRYVAKFRGRELVESVVMNVVQIELIVM